MSVSRNILIVEDSPDDAELTVRTLRQGGIELTYRRVDTPEAMLAALYEERWDLVIADYSMPQFSGLAALKILRDAGTDLPFILVSGTVGEEEAVKAMKSGAGDYVMKSNLARLPLAVERELREFQVRADRNRAEQQYRMRFDRVPVGLFRIAPRGPIFEANSALVEMLGFEDADTLKHASVRDLWLRSEEFERCRAIIERDGFIQNFELEVRRPDDTVIWCEQSARAVHDSAGKVAYYEGVLVDIDSRKRAEQEANRARDQARDLALQTAQLRADFLASMSHEIRTPLVGIIGTGELLSHSGLSQEQQRLTEIIRSSGELLLTIVNDILDFSKLAAGRVELEKLDFDLIKLAKTTVDSFAATACAKGVELALDTDLMVPASVRGDQSRLRQVLSNLLANAIKFTNQGQVTVKLSHVEGTAEDVLVRFEVIDTGIGIPLAAQERLFQPFVQAEGSTHRRYGGTGLGLVIAAKLTEQMGGQIGFESEPGVGSNFYFTVRLEKAPETERVVAHPCDPVAGQHLQWRKDVRVLLVDDNLVNRAVGAKQLSALGYTAELAEGAYRALEILSGEPFDIVLMDCEMPEMDGYQAVAEMRRREGGARHTVVIALSAHAMEGERARCLGAGMDDYLSKPVSLGTLADKLDTWARGPRPMALLPR